MNKMSSSGEGKDATGSSQSTHSFKEGPDHGKKGAGAPTARKGSSRQVQRIELNSSNETEEGGDDPFTGGGFDYTRFADDPLLAPIADAPQGS